MVCLTERIANLENELTAQRALILAIPAGPAGPPGPTGAPGNPGLDGQDTELRASLVSAANPINVNATIQLSGGQLNKLVILGANAVSYNVNLPAYAEVNYGSLMKLVSPPNGGVVTVQSAGSSGVTIDGRAEITMTPGDTVLLRATAAGWETIDSNRATLRTLLVTEAAQFPITTSFQDIEAGEIVLQDFVDWSSHYFVNNAYKTPRIGVYNVYIKLWICEVVPSGATDYGYIDIGLYSSNTMGTNTGPGSRQFSRERVNADASQAYQSITFEHTLFVGKGVFLIPAIRLGGLLTSAKIESSAVVGSVFQVEGL